MKMTIIKDENRTCCAVARIGKTQTLCNSKPLRDATNEIWESRILYLHVCYIGIETAGLQFYKNCECVL